METEELFGSFYSCVSCPNVTVSNILSVYLLPNTFWETIYSLFYNEIKQTQMFPLGIACAENDVFLEGSKLKILLRHLLAFGDT